MWIFATIKNKHGTYLFAIVHIPNYERILAL